MKEDSLRPDINSHKNDFYISSMKIRKNITSISVQKYTEEQITLFLDSKEESIISDILKYLSINITNTVSVNILNILLDMFSQYDDFEVRLLIIKILKNYVSRKYFNIEVLLDSNFLIFINKFFTCFVDQLSLYEILLYKVCKIIVFLTETYGNFRQMFLEMNILDITYVMCKQYVEKYISLEYNEEEDDRKEDYKSAIEACITLLIVFIPDSHSSSIDLITSIMFRSNDFQNKSFGILLLISWLNVGFTDDYPSILIKDFFDIVTYSLHSEKYLERRNILEVLYQMLRKYPSFELSKKIIDCGFNDLIISFKHHPDEIPLIIDILISFSKNGCINFIISQGFVSFLNNNFTYKQNKVDIYIIIFGLFMENDDVRIKQFVLNNFSSIIKDFQFLLQLKNEKVTHYSILFATSLINYLKSNNISIHNVLDIKELTDSLHNLYDENTSYAIEIENLLSIIQESNN